MSKLQVILHITDLHFSQSTTHENDARALAIQSFTDILAEQPAEWHPSIICLTGDIANAGKAEDYRLAHM